jgi:carbon starvation protein
VAVTFTASYQKIFDPNPCIGFWAHAQQLAAEAAANPGRAGELAKLAFNDRLDAIVTGVLVCMVALIVLEAALEWVRVLSGRKAARDSEAPFVLSRFSEAEG